MNKIEKFLIENKQIHITTAEYPDWHKHKDKRKFMVTRIPSEEEIEEWINNYIDDYISVDIYKETAYWRTIKEAIDNFNNKFIY